MNGYRPQERCYDPHDPKTGRYITADPIGLAGGINLFSYVRENPVNWIDPMGLYTNHDELSTKAFRQEKCRRMQTTATQSAFTLDSLTGSQLPQNARWHAMRNGDDPKQTVEDAKLLTEQYITDQLSKYTADGLGRALHARQDQHAGGHTGYQPWANGSDLWTHLKKDRAGGGQAGAIADSVLLIKRFKEMCPCACGE